MTVGEGLGVFGTAVSLIALGFGMGAAYVRRHRSSHSLRGALENVRQALSKIAVNSVDVIPPTAPVGTQIRIDFDVTSQLPVPLDVWLGADIPYADDQYFYDITQDKVVSVEPGRQRYSRYLTLAPPLSSGHWIMNAGLWFGKKSDPDHSIRLMLRTIDIVIT